MLSAVTALKKTHAKNGHVKYIQDQIGLSGKNFINMWVSAHIGIRGNEKADELAKNSVNNVESGEKFMTFENCKSLTKNQIWELRQREWYIYIENKLAQLIESVRSKQELSGLTRKEATVITRLRIGHTNRTHAYLF